MAQDDLKRAQDSPKIAPGPKALGPVGHLIAAARWKEAPVKCNCCCNCFLAAVIGVLAAVIGL